MTSVQGIRTGFYMCFLATLLIGIIPFLPLEAAESNSMKSLSPEKVADYIHSIVEADRKIYTTHIVKRMQEQGVVLAREDWENKLKELVNDTQEEELIPDYFEEEEL